MSYRSNFVRHLGHTPLFLGQGAPLKVTAPANPWRSPHCCQQETKMAHLVRAIAQCSRYHHNIPVGVEQGGSFSVFLHNVQIFNEATNLNDQTFLQVKGKIWEV